MSTASGSRAAPRRSARRLRAHAIGVALPVRQPRRPPDRRRERRAGRALGAPARGRRPTCSSAAASTAPRRRRADRELSGGELARAGLAVALANDPPSSWRTSPRGSSTRAGARGSLDLLRERADGGAGVVLVTHTPRSRRPPTAQVDLRDGRGRVTRERARRAARRRRRSARARADGVRRAAADAGVRRRRGRSGSRSSGPSGLGQVDPPAPDGRPRRADGRAGHWPAIGAGRDAAPRPGRRRLPGRRACCRALTVRRERRAAAAARRRPADEARARCRGLRWQLSSSTTSATGCPRRSRAARPSASPSPARSRGRPR